jgi:hypothetical protein
MKYSDFHANLKMLHAQSFLEKRNILMMEISLLNEAEMEEGIFVSALTLFYTLHGKLTMR